jgi:hypothetical protein
VFRRFRRFIHVAAAHVSGMFHQQVAPHAAREPLRRVVQPQQEHHVTRSTVTRADMIPANPMLARASSRVVASVIIPAYNECRVIARTLNTLTASMRPEDHAA